LPGQGASEFSDLAGLAAFVIIKITLTIYLPPSRFSGAMSAPLTPISAPSYLQSPFTC
jgi:hypothetical protein